MRPVSDEREMWGTRLDSLMCTRRPAECCSARTGAAPVPTRFMRDTVFTPSRQRVNLISVTKQLKN
jgi:hypothetical protein